MCANEGDNARAFKISPPSLSLAVNYSYLGDGFRVPVPAMTNARLFIILSASNEQRRFRKCRFESNPLALLLLSQPASLSPALVHVGNDDPRGGRTIEIAILAPDIYRWVEDYSRVNKR